MRAAWEKAGAKVGWIGVDGFSLAFRPGIDEGKPGELAAFQFAPIEGKEFSAAGLAKLPAPAQGFGLDFEDVLIDDAELKAVAKFSTSDVQVYHIGGSKLTASGLKALVALQEMRQLQLSPTEIADEGLKHLAEMKHLQGVFFSSYRISDNGLKNLADLPELQWLDVSYSTVDDAGLKDLSTMQKVT